MRLSVKGAPQGRLRPRGPSKLQNVPLALGSSFTLSPDPPARAPEPIETPSFLQVGWEEEPSDVAGNSEALELKDPPQILQAT